MVKKIVVTGGSGTAGRAVIKDLVEHGYNVLNVDTIPPQDSLAPYLKVDLTDMGQVCEALSGAQGVVHLAAIPAPGILTEAVTFHNNMTSTYNIFSAATMLGLERVVWASSIRTVGFPLQDNQPDYVPIDEAHPFYADSSYALSKILNEEMARQFHRWSGIPFIGLRFAQIITPDRYHHHFGTEDTAEKRKNELWSYVDVRDAAQSCRLGLEAPIKSAEVFIITADDIAINCPGLELMRKYFPDVPIREDIRETETLFSLKKAQKLLGYIPRYSWRMQQN